jgi:hypothetical protein
MVQLFVVKECGTAGRRFLNLMSPEGSGGSVGTEFCDELVTDAKLVSLCSARESGSIGRNSGGFLC